MSKVVDSVLIRPRVESVAAGVAIGCFAIWLLFSPAGWPFYSPEKCTWEQWVFARAAIPLAGILAAYRFAVDESKRILRADAGGFTLFDQSLGSWLFEWSEVSKWWLTCGGWRTTESEGGSQYEVFHPNDRTLTIVLVDGRQVSLCLPIFGYIRKSDELLVVLRLFVGDCEAPVVVLSSNTASRRKE